MKQSFSFIYEILLKLILSFRVHLLIKFKILNPLSKFFHRLEFLPLILHFYQFGLKTRFEETENLPFAIYFLCHAKSKENLVHLILVILGFTWRPIPLLGVLVKFLQLLRSQVDVVHKSGVNLKVV